MSLTWAIQSGLSISEMPATFKADYDRLIPDYESDLSGDFFQELEDTYKKASRLGKLPPLEVLLDKMGPAGKTVLTAKRQREALLAQGQSDEVKEQTLFAGQESGIYAPVKAEEGPWTERIPGVAYMRYKIVGGNIASNNVMEIRIVGEGSPVAETGGPARIVTASYAPGQFGSMLTLADADLVAGSATEREWGYHGGWDDRVLAGTGRAGADADTGSASTSRRKLHSVLESRQGLTRKQHSH